MTTAAPLGKRNRMSGTSSTPPSTLATPIMARSRKQKASQRETESPEMLATLKQLRLFTAPSMSDMPITASSTNNNNRRTSGPVRHRRVTSAHLSSYSGSPTCSSPPSDPQPSPPPWRFQSEPLAMMTTATHATATATAVLTSETIKSPSSGLIDRKSDPPATEHWPFLSLQKKQAATDGWLVDVWNILRRIEMNTPVAAAEAAMSSDSSPNRWGHYLSLTGMTTAGISVVVEAFRVIWMACQKPEHLKLLRQHLLKLIVILQMDDTSGNRSSLESDDDDDVDDDKQDEHDDTNDGDDNAHSDDHEAVGDADDSGGGGDTDEKSRKLSQRKKSKTMTKEEDTTGQALWCHMLELVSGLDQEAHLEVYRDQFLRSWRRHKYTICQGFWAIVPMVQFILITAQKAHREQRRAQRRLAREQKRAARTTSAVAAATTLPFTASTATPSVGRPPTLSSETTGFNIRRFRPPTSQLSI